MPSNGKSEMMASVFAVAYNDFMQEYTDTKEETYPEEPANQPAEAPTGGAGDNDAPQQPNKEREEERKSCWTCIEWFLRRERSLLKK
jgi:hypothetical protein